LNFDRAFRIIPSQQTPHAGVRSERDKMSTDDPKAPSNFIRHIIDEDLASGKHAKIQTRFPPEPNGYLHIGHAKSICLNFGLARDYQGTCNLRFDDTNPAKEEVEYVESIMADVRWLGFDWESRLFYASDYFGQLYEWALHLIRNGDAYVDSLSAEEVSEYRGKWYEPGKESPYRDRTVQENLDLFEGMRAGKFKEGEHVLRAKIDMAASNPNLRDPAIYRVKHADHHRTGSKWCIYPTYDFAHGQSDAIEEITHSLCTLEFEVHRPLYDWFVEHLPVPAVPRQIEFARLNLSHTILSKRNLLRLVEEGHVDGWDDPRMPTLAGFRRRGFTPESIRNFCDRIGLAKADSTVDVKMLDHSLREHLEVVAPRRMGVLRPLKVVIDNYPEDQTEEFDFPDHPDYPERGARKVPFSREIYIERTDFMEEPVRKFFRLAPGREVRLRWAYFITCVDVIKDDDGQLVELHCTYDPESRGGNSPDGRRVKGTLHWVDAHRSVEAEVRLFEQLFTDEEPKPSAEDFTALINPNARQILTGCRLEPSLAECTVGEPVQFERQGYFCVDSVDSKDDALVFNRSTPLRDSWGKKQQANKQGKRGKGKRGKGKRGKAAQHAGKQHTPQAKPGTE